MSQIVRSLLELLQRRSYHSGDLLFSTEILRNVTDTFKRATYIPAPDDVQVGVPGERWRRWWRRGRGMRGGGVGRMRGVGGGGRV